MFSSVRFVLARSQYSYKCRSQDFGKRATMKLDTADEKLTK